LAWGRQSVTLRPPRMTAIPGRAGFDTTHWSVVRAAGGVASGQAREALAILCESYWGPLYWYVRRRGYDAEDAQDLTQAFLTRLLEKHDVQAARSDRGRFRSFLLASLEHFICNEAQSRRAQKRGGGMAAVSLSFDAEERRYGHEPADTRTPETVFDRRWAFTVLDRGLKRLREEAIDAGGAQQFERLKLALLGESPAGGYETWAHDLGLTEGAVKVAVHRLRRRFQQVLRNEIADTVASPEEVEEELRYLWQALRR
jgi:DNA-directed RNA polymerase specialized sigma24 family protein